MRYLLPDEALLLLCHQMGRYEFLLLFHLQKLTECYISEFLSQHHLCLHRQIFPLSLRYHLLCLCYLRFLYPLRLDQTRELFPRLLQTYLPLSESYPDTLHLFHSLQQHQGVAVNEIVTVKIKEKIVQCGLENKIKLVANKYISK